MSTYQLAKIQEAREQLQAEMQATLARKQNVEDKLCHAFNDAIDDLGYVRAIEALARTCEGRAELSRSDAWAERAESLFLSAQIGTEDL